MLEKIKSFINKDVSNDNEVKMYSVIMRVLLIYLCVYTLIGIIFAAAGRQLEPVLWSIGVLTVSCILFALTYNNRTSIATCGFCVLLTVVMCIHLNYYGLGTTVLQYSFVQVVAIYALDYLPKKYLKVLSLLAVLASRCVLYMLFKDKTPMYGSDSTSAHWQAVNMIVISLMIATTIVIATADFTEMRAKFRNTNFKLRDVAGRDPLTQLFNRRAGYTFIQEQMAGFDKGEVSAITLAMADIDHFKSINDTYGHDNGDEVLKCMANVMGAFMRENGVAIRWGGEEFVLAFININGDDAYTKLCDLQKLIADQKFTFNGDEVKITFTFGLSEFGKGDTMDSVVKEADSKLYLGKEKGRNIIIY